METQVQIEKYFEMYSLDHRKCAVQCTEIFQHGACPICQELGKQRQN